MLIRLMNTRVPDHILVKGVVTKKSTAYSTNLFCDPNDPEETAYFEDELTPLEKGHVYLWKEDESGAVLVHMPYRIMDKETAVLLKGLSSYRSFGALIARSIPQRMTLSPKSCLQDFLLSYTDFKVFSHRVESLGGITEKDAVDLDQLLKDMQYIISEANSLQTKIGTLREKYCVSSSEEVLDTEEKLNEVLKEFAWVREEITELGNKRVLIVKKLATLKCEINRTTDHIRASAEQEQVQEALKLLNQPNFDRITREAIHKHNIDSGREQSAVVPAHICSLANALHELRMYYPALTKLSGHGENVVISLSGLRLILTPTTIKVEGDPSVLKPYMGEGATVDASGNASLRRRRRNIVPDVKK